MASYLARLLLIFTSILTCFATAETRLSYTTSSSPSATEVPVLLAWAEYLKSESDGEIELEMYWQQSLSKLANNLRAVSSGLADMGVIVPSYSQSKMPINLLSSTTSGSGDPYVAGEAWIRTRQQHPAIAAEDEELNLKFLYNYSIGPVVLMGDKHYLSPEDFKGETMRLTSHYTQTGAHYGWEVNAARIRSPEMYTALEKGTISGGATYLSLILPYRLNEVADHMVELNLGQHMNLIYMNLDTWNSLSPKIRKLIDDSLPQLRLDLARAFVEESNSVRATIAKHPDFPVEVVQLNDEQRERWGAMLDYSYQHNVETAAKITPVARSIAEAFRKNIQSLEAEFKQQGYPWTGE